MPLTLTIWSPSNMFWHLAAIESVATWKQERETVSFSSSKSLSVVARKHSENHDAAAEHFADYLTRSSSRSVPPVRSDEVNRPRLAA